MIDLIERKGMLCYEQDGIRTQVYAVSDGILRVTHTRREMFLNRKSAIVIHEGMLPGQVTETEHEGILTVGGIRVCVSRSTGQIALYDSQGQPLLKEADARPHQLVEKPVYRNYFDNAVVREGQSVDGARASAEPTERRLDRTAYECRQSFVFDEKEGLYGLGSHEEGFGNLRGRMRMLYQHNMKAVVPVLVSTRGWGIVFDMGCLMTFHDDEDGSYLWADCADELDWYFLYGDGSYASLMQLYRALTGEAPMLPKYAMGYIQSKERYVSAQEMLEVADEYRRLSIPLDMLVLDWQSWPKGQWGWKAFDPERFPDPQGFTDLLHDKNVRLMLSIWPSMQGECNADRAQMLEKGYMLGNHLIYDAFNPNARALYWEQARKNLFSKGVDAWWCDCSEPFESDWHGEIKPEPAQRMWLNTEEAKKYLDPADINLYSLYHSQGIYEGQRSVRNDKRVLNLTRSSYAGQHRSATVTWSGDVSASWETLRRQIPEGLNFCVTGEPYWSTDIGGFFPMGGSGPWFLAGEFNMGVKDLGYRELFVRWMQYSVFLPMMRTHGTGTPREIWQFGEKGEPFYDAIEQAIRLRYRLIPYLYSLMAQTNREGLSMLRIPALVFPEDTALRGIDDQMMLGDAILVKPVTRPMYYLSGSQVITERDEHIDVALPDGCRWYALDSGERYDGGQTISVAAPLDRIPAFVREGTILPISAPVQCTAELHSTPLELIVYPGADGRCRLYDDAGDGYGYEKGESVTVQLSWDDTLGELILEQRQGHCTELPDVKELCIHRVDGPARTIFYDGSHVTVRL